MMHAVGVIPEKPEIGRSRLHGSQAFNDGIGVNRAGGVAVFGDAPHAFDGSIVGDQAYDFAEVGPIVREWNGDHANAVVFANLEMTVVAGDRAKKRDIWLLGPGREPLTGSLQQGVDDAVMH